MKNAGQLFLGLLSAIGTALLVLSAASLALLEGGASISSVIPATQTAVPAPTTASAQPIAPVTMTPVVSFTLTPGPTEELQCQNTPADWTPYAVQQGDTILLLVVKSGVSTDEFLSANCFVSASMRLEPGWVVYLPPTAPTATATMTPTPEPPTPTSCGAPYGWVSYVVRPGDTLFRLSLSLGITVQQLQSANCLTGTQINAGQILRVPFIPPLPTLATRTPTATVTPEVSDTVAPPTLTFTPTHTPVTPVGKQDQTITFAAPPDQVFGPDTFTISASASSQLPVSFSATGNCTISGTVVTLTGAGSCSITASQPGDNKYNPADPVTRTFQIFKATPTIEFNRPADKTFGDPPFPVTATTSSDMPVTFSASGNCTASASVITITGAGNCTVTASVAESGNYTGASAAQTFQIAKASQTIKFSGISNRNLSDSPFTLSATSPSGETINFSTSTPGTCAVSGNVVTLISAGSCTITASERAGNANYFPATDVSQTFQIN